MKTEYMKRKGRNKGRKEYITRILMFGYYSFVTQQSFLPVSSALTTGLYTILYCNEAEIW